VHSLLVACNTQHVSSRTHLLALSVGILYGQAIMYGCVSVWHRAVLLAITMVSHGTRYGTQLQVWILTSHLSRRTCCGHLKRCNDVDHCGWDTSVWLLGTILAGRPCDLLGNPTIPAAFGYPAEGAWCELAVLWGGAHGL
jgi:hypothetical protein